MSIQLVGVRVNNLRWTSFYLSLQSSGASGRVLGHCWDFESFVACSFMKSDMALWQVEYVTIPSMHNTLEKFIVIYVNMSYSKNYCYSVWYVVWHVEYAIFDDSIYASVITKIPCLWLLLFAMFVSTGPWCFSYFCLHSFLPYSMIWFDKAFLTRFICDDSIHEWRFHSLWKFIRYDYYYSLRLFLSFMMLCVIVLYM